MTLPPWIEAIVGAEPRLALVAQDLVAHFEQRVEAMNGKAMVVCMSRRICIDLYRELVGLRPDWHHEDDDKGHLKVVMSAVSRASPGAPHPWRRQPSVSSVYSQPAFSSSVAVRENRKPVGLFIAIRCHFALSLLYS